MLTRTILCLAVFVSATSGLALPPHNFASCPFPNGTATKLNFFTCPGSSNDKIAVTDVFVTDINGKQMYPMDPKQPFILTLKSFNSGAQVQDNKVDVKIFEYKSGWSGNTCTWSEMPTFGLMNNIDGCEFAKDCPLKQGEIDMKIKLDLSSFSAIISLLSDNTPIELQVKLRNGDAGRGEEIACVIAQIKIV